VKLLQIIDNIDPSASEGCRVLTISNQLARRGHSVTLVACETPSIDTRGITSMLRPGVEMLWHRPLAKFHSFYFSPELYHKIQGKYDLIHAHSYRHHGTLAGSLKGYLTKTPLVLSPYGSVSVESTKNLKSYYLIQDALSFKLPVRSASRILAETNYEKEIITSFGGSPERIDVIHRDVDTDLFQRRENSIFDNPETLLYVGRVTRIKGIELLLRACADLPRTAELCVIGSCDDKQYLNELLSLARRLNILERIRFMGAVDHREVPKYLSSAKVLILPSLFENLGGIIMEAQACECPVVASDVGGVREIMVDGETGFLLKERSHRELSLRLTELLSDDKLIQDMGRRGRAFIMSHFTIKHYMRKILDSYSKALNH
jgi:glycosyltransferase involved in cell wall biosynthesis